MVTAARVNGLLATVKPGTVSEPSAHAKDRMAQSLARFIHSQQDIGANGLVPEFFTELHRFYEKSYTTIDIETSDGQKFSLPITSSLRSLEHYLKIAGAPYTITHIHESNYRITSSEGKEITISISQENTSEDRLGEFMQKLRTRDTKFHINLNLVFQKLDSIAKNAGFAGLLLDFGNEPTTHGSMPSNSYVVVPASGFKRMAGLLNSDLSEQELRDLRMGIEYFFRIQYFLKKLSADPGLADAIPAGFRSSNEANAAFLAAAEILKKITDGKTLLTALLSNPNPIIEKYIPNAIIARHALDHNTGDLFADEFLHTFLPWIMPKATDRIIQELKLEIEPSPESAPEIVADVSRLLGRILDRSLDMEERKASARQLVLTDTSEAVNSAKKLILLADHDQNEDLLKIAVAAIECLPRTAHGSSIIAELLEKIPLTSALYEPLRSAFFAGID